MMFSRREFLQLLGGAAIGALIPLPRAIGKPPIRSAIVFSGLNLGPGSYSLSAWVKAAAVDGAHWQAALGRLGRRAGSCPPGG